MVDLLRKLWFTWGMDKSQLIKIFGSGVNLANALGVSKQYVSQMPEKLEKQKYKPWVLGAAMRSGIDVSEYPEIFGKDA